MTSIPHYKAQRPEPPADLRPQFGLIRQATRAFNVACVEQDNYEADDLIATYARQAVEAGATCRIVSSDKDLMQLIRPGVTLYDTMKDRDVGEAEVLEKFGVTPDKVIDVQALAGDSVDNVPGVPGIGVKTAAQLITEYGDLETLLARASEIKQQKRRENLIEFAEQARISKRLVTLDDQVPVEHDVSDFAVDHAQGLPAHRLPQGAGVHQLHQEGGRRTRRRHGGHRACAGRDQVLAAGGRRDHGGWHEGGSTRAAATQRSQGGDCAARAVGQRRCAERHSLPPRGLRDGDRSCSARRLDRRGERPGLSRRRHRDRCAGFDAGQSGRRVAGHRTRQGLLRPAGPQGLGRRALRRRCGARPDRGQGSTRPPQAAARGSGGPEDRPEPEIRHRGAGAERHRSRADRRHHADFLCARVGRCGPWHGRALRSPSGPQADQLQGGGRAPASRRSASTAWSCAAPPTMRRKTPT